MIRRGLRWQYLYAVLIVFSAWGLAHAACSPILSHDDPANQREFGNVYQSLCFPQISTGTAQNFYISSGTVNSFMVVGTTTNDSAPTGRLGEYKSSSVSGITYPATGVFGDATSIALGAGDWLVTIGGMDEINAASNQTTFQIGFSVTSGNFTTGLTDGVNRARCLPATAATDNTCTQTARMSLSAASTVYFKYMSSYTAGGPPKFYGGIQAWRIR